MVHARNRVVESSDTTKPAMTLRWWGAAAAPALTRARSTLPHQGSQDDDPQVVLQPTSGSAHARERLARPETCTQALRAGMSAAFLHPSGPDTFSNLFMVSTWTDEGG